MSEFLVMLCAVTALAQTIPDAHFHHIHLNSTDPAAAIDFYTTKFDSEKANFEGVRTQKSWILFTKVSTPPLSDITSTIWHFGWGAEDMRTSYQKQLDSGTKFQTPLTDISDIGGGTQMGRFFYAYVDGPDHSLIEMNTANHHHFGHLHLLSADPVAAGEWYEKHFGVTGLRKAPGKRMYRDVQIAPSSSMMMDNVNIIIYPQEYFGLHTLESTRGHVVDHIAISVPNVDEAIAKLKASGVKVIDQRFIEGPDKMRIEIVQYPP
jgi:catechol 2,3-dioxygenase-like lactoylglutathione lyase family enzyme